MDAPYYHIVYMCVFAATMSENDQTSADPLMRFNLDSSVLPQDHRKQTVRFFFKLPQLFLMKAHYYSDGLNNCGYLDNNKVFVLSDAPVHLFPGCLLKDAHMDSDKVLMFKIKVEAPLFEINIKTWFDEHFEGLMIGHRTTNSSITQYIDPGAMILQ